MRAYAALNTLDIKTIIENYFFSQGYDPEYVIIFNKGNDAKQTPLDAIHASDHIL